MASGTASYREGQGRRAGVALAASVIAHLTAAFLVLRPWGESALTGHARIVFVEGHTGRYGPLRLMPELNLSQGEDPVTQPALPPQRPVQLPKTPRIVRASAHASEAVHEPPPDLDTPGTIVPTEMPAPTPGTEGRPLPADANAVPGPASEGQVELNRPGQTSPDFVLLEFVRPRYPAGVPDVLRRRRIVVHAAMYVNLDGSVADAYIIASEGGALFDDAVLLAVRQWRYRPLQVAGEAQPFWDQVKVTFVGAPTGKPATVKVEGG